MIKPHEIITRLVRGFGARPTDVPASFSTPDGDRSVGVVPFTDCPARGITSWGTLGSSAFETPFTTPDGRGLRVEFVAAVDAQLDRFAEALAACAFELKPDVDVRPGTVYRGVVERSYSPVTTPHLFSVAPFLWDEPFEPFDDDDVHVTWLQLVPITDAEAAYAKSHGADALEAAFMQAQPDVFSVTRESVPLPVEGA